MDEDRVSKIGSARFNLGRGFGDDSEVVVEAVEGGGLAARSGIGREGARHTFLF